MKRLGIFFCNEKNGIIDDYITYLLEDISQNLEELCIVSNKELTKNSQNKLKKYADTIIIRLKKGFDARAFRDVMINHYGFKKLIEFDEIVLFNDSFFGPFYPFKMIFDEMDNEDIDFWGISDQGEAITSNKSCPYEKPPCYIETYFLVFRKNLVKSNEFQKYWKNLPDYKKATQLKFKHEVVFTKYFSDLGYKWKTYFDSSKILGKTMDFLSYDMYNSVVNRDLPILKIESFKLERDLHLHYNLVKDLPKTINYLKENTNYDVSLIYKYLLRTVDPDLLVNILNLVKIFPKNNELDAYKTNKKVLLIMHLYYKDIWEYDFKYLKNVPEYIDILITTDTNAKKEFFELNMTKHLKNKTVVKKINSRGRDMASLLVASQDIIKKYDYFCFIHDKKPHTNDFITWAETFREVLWESTLASPDYINKIIKEFDEDEFLGLITPPRIYHGNFFHGHINNFWVENYNATLELLDQMGINTPISKKHPPLTLGNCFWAKYDAVEPIFELYLNYDDFSQEPMPLDGTISHAIERVYAYVAASRCYYTEIVMTDEHANAEILNHNFMLLKTVQELSKKKINIDVISSFHNFYNSLKKYFLKN